MSSTPPIPSSSASAVQVKTGNGVTSTNVQAALVELQGEITSAGGVAELKAAVHYDGDYSALSLNNTSDNSAALQAILTAAAGKIISLPEGIINIDGTSASTDPTNYHILQLRANTTLRGSGDGTTIRIRNPRTSGGTQRLLWMRDGSSLENITIICDPSTPPTVQQLSLVLVMPDLAGFVLNSTARPQNVSLRNVKIYGPGQTSSEFRASCHCISIWYAKDTTLENCTIKYSSGSAYGVNAVGFDGLRITGCDISENAADGLKYFGDATFGACKRLFVQDTRLNNNGQVNIQGQTLGTTLGNGAAIANGASPGRYRIETASSNVSVYLPLRSSVSTGTQYLISKKIAAQTNITLRPNASDSPASTITGFGATSNTIVWDGVNVKDKHVLVLTAAVGGWTSAQFTNGEGADGCCDGFVFMNCEADGNEGSGFQSKNDTTSINKCRDGFYAVCRSSNSWFGNGFGIVQNGGTARPAMTNIAIVDSVAYGNDGNGLIANSQDDGTGSYGLIMGLTIDGFVASSNKNSGITLTRDVTDVVGSDIRLYGNGTTGNAANCHNMNLMGVRNVRFSGVTMIGVDPTAGGLGTEAAIDSATPVCTGLYLEKTIAGLTMSNVVIDKIHTRRHNGGNDYLYYTSAGVVATDKDFEQNVTINKYPNDTEIWRASTSTDSTCIRIGNPLYNILEDRTKENQGIISGAYGVFPNRLLGVMSHRWIFGSYDNHVRESISTYIIGSNHNVVMNSSGGHSFIMGNACNTNLTDAGEGANHIGSGGCTAGKSYASTYTSQKSTVIGDFSHIIESKECTINLMPDSSKFGPITSAGITNANPQNGQTMVVTGTNFGSVGSRVTIMKTDSTGATIGHPVPVEFDITQVSGGSTTFSVAWPTRGTNNYAPNFLVGDYVAVVLAPYSADDKNSIVGSYQSNIWRGFHNTIEQGYQCNSKVNYNGGGTKFPVFTRNSGYQCETNAPWQDAIGYGAKPTNFGERAIAPGWFQAAGDFQRSTMFLGGTTTNTTRTDLGANVAVLSAPVWIGEIWVPGGYTWFCEGSLIARKRSGGDMKIWKWDAVLKSTGADAGLGPITILGFNSTVKYESTPAGATKEWYWLLYNGGTQLASTFDATDTITTGSNHGYAVGDAIQVTNSTPANVPSPYVCGNIYYVVNVPTATTFKLSATPGGTAITAAGAGTGTTNTEKAFVTAGGTHYRFLPKVVGQASTTIDWGLSMTVDQVRSA